MSTRSLKSLSRALVPGLLAGLLTLTPTPAQSGEREIDTVRERILAMLRQAEELQKEGREERAVALRQEADQLRQRLRARASLGTREQEPQGREDAEEILRGLRQGMAALRALGRMDALEQMERIAVDVERELEARARREDENTELGVARRQLRIVGLATEILADAGREDAAEALGRVFRTRRAALEGQQTDIAPDSLPSRGNQAELMMLAARILRERGQLERAAMVDEYARQVAGLSGRGERDQPRNDEDNAEIREARRQVELMRMALRALASEERDDAADLLERAIVVREMALEGRRDEEAQEMRRSAPGRGNQAELLMLAARILAERGREDRAEVVTEYARQLAVQARRIREAGERREEPPAGREEQAAQRRLEQIESLEARLDELQGAMRELQAALQNLRRGRGRD